MRKFFCLCTIMILAASAFAQTKAKTGFSTTNGVTAPTVALSCNAGAGTPAANGFNFYRSTSLLTAGGAPGSGGGSLLNSALQSPCTFTDTTLSFGVQYYYAATAVNTASCPTGQTCESGYSNIVTVTAIANPIPNPPVLAAPVVTASNQVQLNWTEAGGASAFRVYQMGPQKWYRQIAVGLPCCSYKTGTLAPGVYTFEVAAVNHIGNKTYLSPDSQPQTVAVP